jgi:hypothetical protein
MVARTKPNEQDDSVFDDNDVPGYVILSENETRQYFDGETRRELGISGDEFLRRWDAGEYRPIPDTPAGWKIGRLYMLMRLVRDINPS